MNSRFGDQSVNTWKEQINVMSKAEFLNYFTAPNPSPMNADLRRLLTLLLLLPVLADAQTSNPMPIPPLLSGKNFSLSCDTSSVFFYPGMRTSTFGVNGAFLGPTLEFQKWDTVSIDVMNNLQEMTTMHWHGMHVPGDMDGGPYQEIMPGMMWNATYRVLNNAGTYWYHPHPHMMTQSQVTMGMAGFIIVRDSAEAALALPREYGVDDFPVVLQDRKWNTVTGQFEVTALGDSMLINGVPNAYLDVPSRIVRLRVLNGSNARVYQLGFLDNRTFQVIGNDGGLLAAPVTVSRLLLSNGERAEILLDLNGLQGDSLQLMSYATEMSTTIPGNMSAGMGGTGPLERVDFPLLKLRVQGPGTGGVTSIPATLVPQYVWNPNDVNRIRNRTITGMGMPGMGNFYLDGNTFSMNFVNDTMRLGDIEVWYMTNASNMAHPMHTHDVQFYILEKNGQAPPPEESGAKDVVLIVPGDSITIITRFLDYADVTSPYMYHCHNLAHEDMGMMTSFVVIDTATTQVRDLLDQGFAVYPNPSSTDWTLHMANPDQPLEWKLTDLQGAVIQQQRWTDTSGKDLIIPGRNLAPGLYLLSIQSGTTTRVARLVRL
ncbi:MAG: multicopper oxidase domain-containing protein [Bacteroidia bacterium]|nr:multicopper oxidase domain-containing protein [Bacteroidia bacterium]